MDYYTGLEKEDCNTVADVENDLVTTIISMDLKEFLIGEDKRGGSDEETAPTPSVRRSSMVNIWLEQAKQEDTMEQAGQEEDPLGLDGLSREQAEQEEDPLGLKGLRRIKPDGRLDEEVEASTLSLSQLQLQPSASFQPSSINDILTNQTQPNSFQQHNQGLVSSNNQGVASSHNDIDFIPYVHPYSARPRLTRSSSPAHPATKSPAHPSTNTRSPVHPPTNTRFGDGCTFKPDNHPSCREERRPRSQENNGRSSSYNTDLSLRDVNPETNYINWSTNSNSDTVPPYLARINAGSVSGFLTSSSASNFQTSTGSVSSFQTTIGSASNFQNTTGSASSFQTKTGSAMSFQTSTGSASNFQNTMGSASSFQPFSTVRDEDRSRSQSFGGGIRPTLVGQPGGPRLPAGPRWTGRRGNGRRFCNFCKTNGESCDVYLSHSTGAPGAVTCPNLFKHECEICGATGRNAHTRGCCPQRKSNSTPVVLELKGTQRKSDGSFR